jgi:alpha-tubulin suppressor-like RCC1 family protein
LDLATFTSGSTGIRILGSAANAYCGNFGGGGGDINNDGYDDVLIGCRQGNPGGRVDAGTVWVIYGHGAPYVDLDLASFPATAGYRIGGAAAGHWTYPCAIIGDMNGDSYDDIVVGAHWANTVTNKAGIGYILFGQSSQSNIDLATFTFGTNLGFKLTGSVSNNQLGEVVATAGDFNGDGYADALVASYLNDYAYLLFGHSTATNFPNIVQSSWQTSSTVGFKITSTKTDTRPFGTAGDINGDGIDDIIFSSSDGSSFGTTCVIYGHRTGTFPDITLPGYATSTAGFQIIGAVSGHNTQIIFGGDFNSDGRLDLLAFSPGADPLGRTNAGMATVIFGKSPPYSNIALSSFTTSEANGYQIFGAAASDGTNHFPLVARIGDVDGDGVDDLAYTASNADQSGRTDAGVAYIILSTNLNPTSQPSSQPSQRPSSQPTALPSTRPSSQPTALPSRQPSSLPSAQPSAQPVSTPTLQPSVNLPALRSILSSPTYRVRNGFAFAVLTSTGAVITWGEATYGGDSSSVHVSLMSDVVEVVAGEAGYCAIKADGHLVTWGVNVVTTGVDQYAAIPYVLSAGSVVANEGAFAGVDVTTGRVISIGSKFVGGDVLGDAFCNGYSQQLSAGVRSIAASAAAFAAVKTDGSVYVWGNKYAGAGAGASAEDVAALGAVKSVVATRAAFAAILATGGVIAWGDRMGGGDTSAVATALSGVHHIVASRYCFVAFKKDSSVVVWGYGEYGGDTSSVAAFLASDVIFVAHTYGAFAAVKADGTVAAWGDAEGGGDASAVQSSLQDITVVVGNGYAFAALTSAGGVVAWGKEDFGGAIPPDKINSIASAVVSIHHTVRAFAALKSDGSVVVWGQAGHGGEPGAAVEALLTSGVHTVCANDVAFSAIKTDGNVVAWGHRTSVASAGVQFTAASLTQPPSCK